MEFYTQASEHAYDFSLEKAVQARAADTEIYPFREGRSAFAWSMTKLR
jgi:hypothetical protein